MGSNTHNTSLKDEHKSVNEMVRREPSGPYHDPNRPRLRFINIIFKKIYAKYAPQYLNHSKHKTCDMTAEAARILHALIGKIQNIL